MTTEERLTDLARALVLAKHEEDEAKKQRAHLEDQLAALLGEPEDGSKTTRLKGYAATVRSEINYTVDQETWHEVKTRLDPAWWPVVQKVAPDKEKIRLLQTDAPEEYAKIAAAFTAKKGKTSVTVKEVAEDE